MIVLLSWFPGILGGACFAEGVRLWFTNGKVVAPLWLIAAALMWMVAK